MPSHFEPNFKRKKSIRKFNQQVNQNFKARLYKFETMNDVRSGFAYWNVIEPIRLINNLNESLSNWSNFI